MDPWWGNDIEKVTAVYDRDEERKVTNSATLTWEGPEKTSFLEEFEEWGKGLGAQVSEIERSATKKFVNDLLFFEMVYKPQEDYLQATGRPQAWIDKDMSLWEEQRSKRFGDDIPPPI